MVLPSVIGDRSVPAHEDLVGAARHEQRQAPRRVDVGHHVLRSDAAAEGDGIHLTGFHARRVVHEQRTIARVDQIHVVSGSAGHEGAVPAGRDHVVAVVAENDVHSGAAGQYVVAHAAIDTVVTATGLDAVVAAVAIDLIAGQAAHQELAVVAASLVAGYPVGREAEHVRQRGGSGGRAGVVLELEHDVDGRRRRNRTGGQVGGQHVEHHPLLSANSHDEGGRHVERARRARHLDAEIRKTDAGAELDDIGDRRVDPVPQRRECGLGPVRVHAARDPFPICSRGSLLQLTQHRRDAERQPARTGWNRRWRNTRCCRGQWVHRRSRGPAHA